MTAELLPCPFCGGEPEIINCSVHCNSPYCEAQPYTAGQSVAEAIEAWNRRSASPRAEGTSDERMVELARLLHAYGTARYRLGQHLAVERHEWDETPEPDDRPSFDAVMDYVRSALATQQATTPCATDAPADERAANWKAQYFNLRHTMQDWHAQALAAGYDGVSEVLLVSAEAAKLFSALNAMLTHFGMDEDEWNRPTFAQAKDAIAQYLAARSPRAALSPIPDAPAAPVVGALTVWQYRLFAGQPPEWSQWWDCSKKDAEAHALNQYKEVREVVKSTQGAGERDA